MMTEFLRTGFDHIRRLDLPIVRFLSPDVSGAIDEPSAVEGPEVPELVDAEGVHEGFVPEVHGDSGWDYEGYHGHDKEVVLLLVVEDGVAV